VADDGLLRPTVDVNFGIPVHARAALAQWPRRGYEWRAPSCFPARRIIPPIAGPCRAERPG